jgi:pullulanase/glycogen debranching enzyme
MNCNCCTSERDWYAAHIDPDGRARKNDSEELIRSIYDSLGVGVADDYDQDNPTEAVEWEEFLDGYREYASELAAARKSASILGRRGGLAKSAAKTEAARRNAKLGGRPRKEDQHDESQ